MAAAVTVNPVQVRRRAASLGAIPLTVISSSPDEPSCTDAGAIAERRRFYSVWSPLQADLLQLSSNAVHVVAEHAGHQIHRDRPDLVVKVIVDHVHRIRPFRRAGRPTDSEEGNGKLGRNVGSREPA